MRRGMTATVVVTLLSAVAAVLLLVWSASSGSPLVGPPQGTWGPPPITMQAEPPPDLELETLPPEGTDTPDGPDLNQWLVDAIQLIVLLTLVFGLLHVLRRMLERDKREGAGPPQDRDEELAALLEASGEEVRYRALTQGDPRNAVVACWVALEDAVYRSGLDPDPSRTASELTGKVLTRWEVDPTAIRALSAAYREARFSRHPVTEDQRRAAVDALERIHHDLRRKVTAEQEEREAAEQAAAARRAQAGDDPTGTAQRRRGSSPDRAGR